MTESLMTRLAGSADDAVDGESFHFTGVREAFREIAEATLRHYAKWPRSDPWGSYLCVDQETRQVVGVGSFKFAPTAAGDVEIAYHTLPAFERRGYASAIARELVTIARESKEIRTVVADTLPETNASTRVLEKNGFRSAREAIETDEGRVWRWTLALDDK